MNGNVCCRTQRRSRWTQPAIGAVLVAALGLQAMGQEVSTSGGEGADEAIGCEAAVETVLRDHPLIEAATASVREAEAKASVLRWVAEPEVRLRTDAGTLDDDYRLGLRWPVPAPGAAGARARAGEAQAARRSAELDWTRARLAAQVRRDYAAARYARAEREILERLASRAREFADAVSVLTGAGSATALEKETALLTASEAEENAATARDREQLAVRAVERWTGQTFSQDDGSCAPEADFDLDSGRLEDHPEVRTARARAVAAGYEATAASREDWLWPSFLEVTWVRESDGKDRDGVLLEAGVELPVVNRQGQEAEAREESLAHQGRDVEAEVRAEAESARLRYENAREKVKRHETSIGNLERAKNLVVEGAEAGADPNEVWRLAREIARRERDANQACYEEELARIELRLSAGLP